MVCEALSTLLRKEGFDVVAQAYDGEDALEAIRTHRPQVAVLDLQMPGFTGIEVLRKLQEEKIPTAAVVISMIADPASARLAIHSGARGFVPKDSSPRELSDAVRAAAAGQLYLSPRIALGAVRGLLDETETVPGPDSLTPRERDVLRLLAAGNSSKEIASSLSLSVRTVDGHRAALAARLGISNVAGLVKYALHYHLTDPGY